MPDLQWNYRRWQETEDWTSRGDRWSDDVGGPQAQWFWYLYPRVHRFLPAKRTLEIAPGYGRWTQFLLHHTEELVGVDLAPRCVEACKERFSAFEGFSCYVNDGLTMPMISDRSIDFVFSYGSFVHMEEDVAASYIGEIARTLGPRGVAFIHHSNGGAVYQGTVPRNFSRLSAAFVADCARSNGLLPVSQELHNWGTPPDEPISCISVLTTSDSPYAGELRVLINRDGDAEAARIASVAPLYEQRA